MKRIIRNIAVIAFGFASILANASAQNSPSIVDGTPKVFIKDGKGVTKSFPNGSQITLNREDAMKKTRHDVYGTLYEFEFMFKIMVTGSSSLPMLIKFKSTGDALIQDALGNLNMTAGTLTVRVQLRADALNTIQLDQITPLPTNGATPIQLKAMVRVQ